MRSYAKFLPIILIVCVLFLSIGFSSFSSILTIGDIKASVRPTKNIRVTSFYVIDSSSEGRSMWEEYSVDKISTEVTLPNSDSEVSYMVEVTNLDSNYMMIESISGLPNNISYRLEDYQLKDKLCNENDQCNLGSKTKFKIILENKDGSTVINPQVVSLELIFSVYSYQIIFDANGGEGTMEPLQYTYGTPINLTPCSFHRDGYNFVRWNTKSDGSGISYSNEQLIQSIESETNELILYAQWEPADDSIYYPGVCRFNGAGNDIEGTCAEGQHIDYINTGIAPFNESNFERNFVLSFTIDSVDDSSFNSNGRATIFNMIYENDDSIGKFPGSVLRVESGKWLLQGSRGVEPNYANKVNFPKGELIGKELKLIRYNDGETIKLYYTIGNDGPYLLKDITDMPHPFDTYLTFGDALDYDNVTPKERKIIADVSDISFVFWPAGSSLEDMSGIIVTPPDEGDMETVFYQQGVCEFHGSSTTITGDSCSLYHNKYMINTGVQLFTAEALTKDFDLSFKIDNYDPNSQEINQTTLMNTFRERTGTTGYGILLRKNSGNLQFIFRDGSGIKKEINLSPTTTSTIRIIKKDNNVCYSVNGAPFKYIINLDNITAPFDVPVTFGGSIDINGNPFRYITGELSEMKIDVGHFGSAVVCDSSMQ